MNISYIATNTEELFENSPKEIKDLIESGEINNTTAILGKIYKLPIGSYLALSNVIFFILIGALKPEDVLRAMQDILKLSADDSYKLAVDLEKSILQKVRMTILGKNGEEVKTLVFEGERSPDELRKEILDTTKRESGLVKDQSTPAPATPPSKKSTVITPGSRNQLLEQLQILESIPNDEEISARLEHLREQMSTLDKKSEPVLDSKVALQEFMFGEKGSEVAQVESKSATYSKAPTKYNVDPYREVAEESN